MINQEIIDGKKIWTGAQYIIKEHIMPTTVHIDFRFEMPYTDRLKSFALPKGFPFTLEDGKKLAIRTPAHDPSFMNPPEMLLHQTKGETFYKIIEKGILTIHTFTRSKIVLEMFGEKAHGFYTLICISLPGNEKTWLMFKNQIDTNTTM